jgi:hypothetical protein
MTRASPPISSVESEDDGAATSGKRMVDALRVTGGRGVGSSGYWFQSAAAGSEFLTAGR